MNARLLRSRGWRLPLAAFALLLAGLHPPAAADGGGPPEDGAAASSTQRAAAATRATYMALIRELQAQGQSFAALAHVAQYEARWGASPDSQVLRADALRATGQADAAAQAYRQLLDGPRAAAGHRGLGLLEASQDRWDAAIAQFAAAARLDPTDGHTLGDLGYAQLRAGRIEQARVPLMTAAQLLPRDARTLANLAAYFIAAGQQAQADAVLRSPHVTDSARALLRGAQAEAMPTHAAGSTAEPTARLRLAYALSLQPGPDREASATQQGDAP